MRLSDLIDKGGNALDKPGSKWSAPVSSELNFHVPKPLAPDNDTNNENKETLSQQPPVQWLPSTTAALAKAEQRIKAARKKTYDSTPDAIYQAAQQLNIPIPPSKEKALENAKNAILDVFTTAANDHDKLGDKWDKIAGTTSDIAATITKDLNLALVLERNSDDEHHVLNHCLNSALIVAAVAPNVSTECGIKEIIAAALVHDIGLGILGIDFSYNESADRFKQHVLTGVEALKKMQAPELVIKMVEQHHETIAGTGYPAAIKPPELLICSQILSLTESFERIMSNARNAGKNGKPIENYVQKAISIHRKDFDPIVLKALIEIHGFYPNGTMVELTNRSICQVIGQNNGFPLRPIVKVVIDGSGNHPEKLEVKNLQEIKSLSIIRTITDMNM
ncbi:MAG: HD domain-containing protein [Lentisphaerae bacterium]|nr:HD domain-containing protein [Lentisphaerota bacterium]